MILRHTQRQNLKAPSPSRLRIPRAGRPLVLAPAGPGRWSDRSPTSRLPAATEEVGAGDPPREPTLPESLAWRLRAGRPPAPTPERPAPPNRPTRPTRRAPSGLEREPLARRPLWALVRGRLGAASPGGRTPSTVPTRNGSARALGDTGEGGAPPACLLPAFHPAAWAGLGVAGKSAPHTACRGRDVGGGEGTPWLGPEGGR